MCAAGRTYAVHPETTKLISKVRGRRDVAEKLAVLRDAYKGEVCYLLTCGPSIGETFTPEVRTKLADKLVLSVKHAYDLAPEIADFHLLNSWNYKPYAYRDPKPIVLLERNEKDPACPGAEPDLLFNIPDPHTMEKRLAVTRQFDDYLFTRTLDRPWGPGIVYEMGLYLAIHLGVAELTVFGWDLGEINSPVMEHFFDREPAWKRRLRQYLINTGHRGLARRLLKEPDQETMNKPRIRPGEVEVIADSTKACYGWLKGKGVELNIVSDRSLVDPCVPRIEM